MPEVLFGQTPPTPARTAGPSEGRRSHADPRGATRQEASRGCRSGPPPAPPTGVHLPQLMRGDQPSLLRRPPAKRREARLGPESRRRSHGVYGVRAQRINRRKTVWRIWGRESGQLGLLSPRP
ncbi:hypothetical protein GN956_G18604 [Arapaima gigas]